MVDWSILQPMPNFTQAALSGYQAGQQIQKQKRLDDAMNGLDLERPETLLPLLRADPATGAALIGASTKLAAEKREIAARQATANYIKTLPGIGGSPSPLSAPVMQGGVSAQGGQSQLADDGAIEVRAPQPDPAIQARNAAIDADPEGFMALQAKVEALNKARRERVNESSSAMAIVAQQAMKLPYEQRKAFIDGQAEMMAAHGVSPQMIAQFDPTDANINSVMGQALGLKEMVAQANKDREFTLNLEQQKETARHNRESEKNAAGHLAVSQGELGVHQGALGLAKSKEGRAAKAGVVSGMSTDELINMARGK